MDLEPFNRINPCGYQGLAVTQVLDLGGPGSLAGVEAVLIGELARQFGLVPVSAAESPRTHLGGAARTAQPA
jgi:lipoyl(octanoyl) transferase